MTLKFSPSVALLLVAVLAGVSAASASETPRNHCVDVKNKAAVKAFECVARGENKIIEGGSANVADCYTKLKSAFDRAEASGACPTTSDESGVQQRVSDAENAVLTTLQASQATTPVAERCVAIENRAAADLAHCTAKLFSEYLASERRQGCCGGEYCVLTFETAFRRGTDCAPTSDMIFAVAAAGIPPGTNLTGADLRIRRMVDDFLAGMNLTDADLTEASFYGATATASNFTGADLTRADLKYARLADSDMSGANLTQTSLLSTDLTGVDLTGATISDVSWSGTECPDGTVSNTNGSSPESCCADLNGAVPASCSP